DNTLVIETTGFVDTDRIRQHEPEGDRIVNMSFFHKELHRVFHEHKQGIDCPFEAWRLKNTHRQGFKTQFFYKCDMCLYEANIWSYPTNCKTVDVNIAIIAGTTTGIGQLEKQLVLERNEIINNRAYITVVADGSWAKRSYGTAYDSLFGVGAIIGYRTTKVLFVGIRNKFCTIYHIAEEKDIKDIMQTIELSG
ncbi:hypothetical protein ALC62_11499, partial [Cyphomyrmex costatus]